MYIENPHFDSKIQSLIVLSAEESEGNKMKLLVQNFLWTALKLWKGWLKTEAKIFLLHIWLIFLDFSASCVFADNSWWMRDSSLFHKTLDCLFLVMSQFLVLELEASHQQI